MRTETNWINVVDDETFLLTVPGGFVLEKRSMDGEVGPLSFGRPMVFVPCTEDELGNWLDKNITEQGIDKCAEQAEQESALGI